MDDEPDLDAAVEFLDTDADEVESMPPPGASWRRPAAFVLVLGLSLAGVVASGMHTYRRDLAAERAANTLVLAEVATGDPVTLLDVSSFAHGALSTDPSAQVELDLTSWSPDPITLLPGVALRGPGVTAGSLAPRGSARLAPGQVGHLAGTVTVDCGLDARRTAAAAPTSMVQVRARLANGGIGTTTLNLDTGGESVRDQICLQQGESVAPGNFDISADPVDHTFFLGLTARSMADSPLHYTVTYAYAEASTGADQPTDLLGPPRAKGPVVGVLDPGVDLDAGFAVPVTRCPSTALDPDAQVRIEMSATEAGRPVLLRADTIDLSLLVQAACGRFD